MSRSDGFYVEGTHLLTHFADGDPVVGGDSLAVEQPHNFDRNVTLGDDAVYRHRIHGIDGILTKVERENQRKDFTGGSYGWKDKKKTEIMNNYQSL